MPEYGKFANLNLSEFLHFRGGSMGVFGDYAAKYYESGYSVLPVEPKTKACRLPEWTKIFSYNFPSEEEQSFYSKKYDHWLLGLATGDSSGVIGIDFDYTMADSKKIEALIIGALPPTPVIKTGKKGWTRFYAFDGEVKNQSFDRFGSRMIDVLSTGRLTVLPPSAHSEGSDIYYRWITPDTLLDIDANELPFIHKEHIDQLEEIALLDNSIFNEVLTKDSSRHGKVVGFILKESDKALDIEDLIQKCIGYDDKVNSSDPKGPYFADKRYLDGRRPYEMCKELATRVCEWKKRKKAEKGITWDIGKYPKLHAQGKKASTNYEDFKQFFEFHYPRTRYDLVKRATYTYNGNLKKWVPIENIEKIIESDASQVGLSPSYVDRHLQKWCSSMKPRLLIDIPRWDGKDRIKKAVSCLKFTDIGNLEFEDLFKDWCANIFRRLKDPKNQNRMLILRGSQGIGKDSFLNFMFNAFEQYYSSEIVIGQNQVDNYQTVADLLVGNIPEFDDTHKVSISNLKTLITSPGANFRASYARKADYVPFHINYVSSVNYRNILRDSSGNRRFMIFNLEGIEFNYDHMDQRMLLAQFHHLYKMGYRANPDNFNIVDAILEKETPKDVEELIVEELDQIVTQVIKNTYSAEYDLEKKLRWYQIAEDCEKIARRYKITVRKVQTILNANGYTRRDAKTTYYAARDTKIYQ